MRNVIVTGGSRGLGLGIVRRLAKSGFRPIAIARKEGDEFAAAKQEAEAAGLGSLDFIPFNLAQIDEQSPAPSRDFLPLRSHYAWGRMSFPVSATARVDTKLIATGTL